MGNDNNHSKERTPSIVIGIIGVGKYIGGVGGLACSQRFIHLAGLALYKHVVRRSLSLFNA